ncbi:MAG: putative toxin-antitoxin system toxin component, PIN family, partial [Gammaproteobacteria bacterium]|nr:putative toxin-antitoxin system toxin component, PIN family [Gammaproteobacteria bacterium]
LDLVADYLPWTEAVQIADAPPSTPACRDPDDLPFLHLAIAADADALISGDHDLLCLGDELAVPVLTPADALPLLEKLGPPD